MRLLELLGAYLDPRQPRSIAGVLAALLPFVMLLLMSILLGLFPVRGFIGK